MSLPLIALHDVGHHYLLPNGSIIDAIRDVDLVLEQGEFVALIGANGSGKSTLARHLNGILLPTSGTVLVNGLDTRTRENIPTIRETVGMVFQSPQDQIVGSTVEEDVAFGPENLGQPPRKIAKMVHEALMRVGMWNYRQRPPYQLSAGQAQRVAIAGAIAVSPRLLILDEATSMLDPAGRRSIMEIISDLHAQGVAILLITHFLEEATQAQRVVVMWQGRIVDDGTPREVFSDRERLRGWSLDVPPITRIADSLHRVDQRIPPDILTVSELADLISSMVDIGPSPPMQVTPFQRPSGTGPFLETENLWHTYMSGTPLEIIALRGVDFVINHGESVGLMGGTGSGKSTLMQHLNALLFPQQGKVHINGVNITSGKLDLRLLRRQVAMVFQRPEDQVFSRFVGDDVAYGLRMLGLPREELRWRVRDAMETMGLDFELYRDRLTYTLSGGERRRVALAGALVLGPRALLLDEPTAGLDPAAHKELLVSLSKWRREQNLTLVYSSHTMEDLAEMTQQVVVLNDGKVALRASTREAFASFSKLQSLGLDVPVSTRLTAALRARSVPIRPDLITHDQVVEAVSVLMKAKPLPRA